MRIALVGDWFLPRLGGIELQVRDIARHLIRAGHAVEVITAVPGPECVDGITVHRLDTPRLPGAGVVVTASAFERLQELFDAGRYDVIHVQFGIIAPLAYGAAYLSQRSGIRTVATFHSVLRHFAIPLQFAGSVLGVRDWLVSWTAVSSVVAESMRPLVGNAPISITPNGIDAAWWAPATPPPVRDPESLRAVAVMRLHRRKRPRFLLEAILEAAAQLPASRSLTLLLAGDGPERSRTERRVTSLGLEDVVTLPGWLPRRAVRDALRDADIFLLPSRLEAFGIAALEARCSGVPVVAMESSGAGDFLVHGADSLLARTDRDFIDHLVALASDHGLLARLRKNAATVPAGAGWESVIGRLMPLYGAAAYVAESPAPV